MSALSFFESVDPFELQTVTEHLGLAMAFASSEASQPLIADPTISPRAMVAGMCKAHALGLASAIAQVGPVLGLSGTDLTFLQRDLVLACAAIVQRNLSDARAGVVH